MHLTCRSWLLQIRHVPLAVLLSALDHHKLDLVDLLRVMIRESLDHLAFLQIPNNQCSIFGARSHVSIALADRNVNDDIHVPVKGCLQNKVVFVPNLDYAVIERC